MKHSFPVTSWKQELYVKLLNGTNDVRNLDFNRFLYLGTPSLSAITEGNAITAQRDIQIYEFFSRCKEALTSGTASPPTIVNYYVAVRRYLSFCDANETPAFTKTSIKIYCDMLYQRVLRNEIKSTTYASHTSKLTRALSLIDLPPSCFYGIAAVSSNGRESFEAYSQSDLKKMLPLLRNFFKQTSKQFLESPEKHQVCNKNTASMIFEWQGKNYPICSAINKMISSATFLLAYYTYTNSSQLYQLVRPSRASFSTKDLWYTMPAFKRRAFKVIQVEMGEHSLHIPKYSMEFFDRLLDVSRCMDNRDGALLLNSFRGNSYMPVGGRMLTSFVNIFFRQTFQLYDNRGRELRPQISRFRETGSQLTEYYQGDIAAGILLNNTKKTRQIHYSTGNKFENHSMIQETILIRSEQAKSRSSVTEARKVLHLPVLTLEEYNNRVKPVLSSSAHGSHCDDPFGEKSEKFNRKALRHQLSDGKKLACADLLHCFGCEHQVIIQSVEDIWCLLSFRECITESLYLHLNIQHYKKNFEDVVKYIDTTILPALHREVRVKAERQLSDKGRHPLWQEAESIIFLVEGK